MTEYTCPHCSETLRIPAEDAAKDHTCDFCGQRIGVPAQKKRRRFRRFLKWGFIGVAFVCLLTMVVLAVVYRGAVYNRFIRFPREARAWQAIRDSRVEVELDDGWNAYRGVCHSHSALSHDCMVPFEEILRVMKETERDFICMSDHCVDGKADYSLQWKGVKDGVLFVRGFEMGYGFMPWGLPDGTVLRKDEDPEALARRIEALGGLLFFAHTEEERRWDLIELDGMEIYNIHTDTKDEGGDVLKQLLPDVILSYGTYPDHVFRLFFDRQTAILERWDRLNERRKIVGIGANDCHQNNGFVGTYTERGTLLVEDTSPDTIGEYDLNVLTRLVLRMFFGPLEPGRKLFRFQLDPYERMTRFVATHVLAKELTQEAILDGLKEGRVFVGFDMIADCRGFVYFAEHGDRRAVMGQSLRFAEGVRLRSASPHACRFTVVRHGQPVYRQEGTELDWQPDEPGKYRLEAELNILGEWTPWIYTNPLELTPPK